MYFCGKIVRAYSDPLRISVIVGIGSLATVLTVGIDTELTSIVAYSVLEFLLGPVELSYLRLTSTDLDAIAEDDIRRERPNAR